MHLTDHSVYTITSHGLANDILFAGQLADFAPEVLIGVLFPGRGITDSQSDTAAPQLIFRAIDPGDFDKRVRRPFILNRGGRHTQKRLGRDELNRAKTQLTLARAFLYAWQLGKKEDAWERISKIESGCQSSIHDQANKYLVEMQTEKLDQID